MSRDLTYVDLEFGRNLLLVEKNLNREMQRLHNELHKIELKRSASAPFDAIPGISVVVATHAGRHRLPHLFDSLLTQTLDADRFEVIVVENGDTDGTRELIESYKQSYPSYEFRYFWRAEPSAGGARNLGIDLARRSRTTFVDDDDTLEPEFLANALSVSTGGNVVLSPIAEVHADGSVDFSNSLNQRISSLRGLGSATIVDHPWILGFNACKLVPTWLIRNLRYETALRSGEDLVFWAQLLTRDGVEVAVAPGLSGNAYLRGMREGSVSRRSLSRDFAVTQRLECIRCLNNIPVVASSASETAIRALARAQAGFIGRYLYENPDDQENVKNEIEQSVPFKFPWDVLNKGSAKDLAFLYCFAPFSDTSAVVASKAISERQRVVDVITNDMSRVRNVDSAVSALADKWIDQRVVIDAAPSFAGWDEISTFAERAVSRADALYANKVEYDTVYSRALWVGSHVAAALFKLRHWNVEWTAEFSDPLRRDAEGRPRVGALSDNSVSKRLMAGVESRGFETGQLDSLFDLIEVSTIVLADKLIFTNSNQLEYMASLLPTDELRRLVSEKAIVREHPSPPAVSYYAVESSYSVPPGVVNIGYFGNFYPNRGIDSICLALSNSPSCVREKIRVHVFSNQSEAVRASASMLGVGANVYSNDYLPYMEFLNCTKKFDVLLVTDVERDIGFGINPFLPSKLSDYKGAGRKIWGVVDSGSPMSQMKLDYTSSVGNVPEMISVFRSLVEDM